MPNIWTHILFCEDVADAVTQTYLFSNYEAYMKLGAQGPDPFFYYNFWPGMKKEHIQNIGNALHTRHCGDFLIDLLMEAGKMNAKAKAYVFGFVTHHILDRNTHPYIHYRAGYEENKHQKLEVLIDTIMMEKYHNLKTWKAPVYKEIDVGMSLDRNISLLLYNTIEKHFPELNRHSSSYIHKSYRHMKLALKVLSDPHGWKNTILKSFISPFSHQPIKENTDYLNLNQKTWYHPATKKPSNQSFLDLYRQARMEGIDILTLVYDYWKTNDFKYVTLLTEKIGNISYDTGEPLHLELENRYCEPIV
ncbi:zinc dependent phospholipase C family protein [Virgibacillus sp. Bac332]|uniref:zinc dependent phospholipase C family protein n=1 Tax=Virgibacillus sp. Bac332 TaxID=2419842 RepID=UPI000EF46F5E|nr:zinc dependent phospholipase C family protein [Virgibacillus sp. Bac332]